VALITLIFGRRSQKTNFRDGAFAPLKSLAGMLLAAPAGESIDEFCFSSSQRTLSKDRNALSGPKVEQITVIRCSFEILASPRWNSRGGSNRCQQNMQSRKKLRKRQNALNDVSSTTPCILLLYLENKPVAGFSSVFSKRHDLPKPTEARPNRTGKEALLIPRYFLVLQYLFFISVSLLNKKRADIVFAISEKPIHRARCDSCTLCTLESHQTNRIRRTEK
jgi:hypothetical protein